MMNQTPCFQREGRDLLQIEPIDSGLRSGGAKYFQNVDNGPRRTSLQVYVLMSKLNPRRDH